MLVVSCSWQTQSRPECHFGWLIRVWKTRQNGDDSMQSCCVRRIPKDPQCIAFHHPTIQNAISPIVYYYDETLHPVSLAFRCFTCKTTHDNSLNPHQ